MKVTVRICNKAGYGNVGDEKEVDFPIAPCVGDWVYVDDIARFVGGQVQARYITSERITLEV